MLFAVSVQENETLGAGLEHLPVYREGATDQESARRLEEDRPGFLVRAYRAAGPIFRTPINGRTWVILGGLEANDFVWRHTDLWNFPIMFPGFLEQMGPDHLNNLEGEAHRQKREVLKPAFDHASALRHLPVFNRSFHEQLEGAVGAGPLDLIEFWSEAITRANTQSVVQEAIPNDALRRLVRWERQMLAGLFLGEARHAFYAREEYVQLKSEAFALMGGIVARRLAAPDGPEDNFAGVLRARWEQPGGPPDPSRLVDDLYYILVAGIENTSRLIMWTALYCQFNPKWRDRLDAEVSRWDGTDVRALAAMPTLKAVIMETQRLRPPASTVPRRATRDFEFAGHRVPEGTDILHANVLCHYLDELYEDAAAFRPERFLEGGRFVPRSNGFFGGGVHICLGRNQTMLQAPVALAQMIRYHRFTYPEEPVLRTAMAAPGRVMPAEIWAEISARNP